MFFKNNLDELIQILPNFIQNPLQNSSEKIDLVEVVMDLGRRPEGRFLFGSIYLSEKTIFWQDLDYSIKRIGKFDDDNRAGIKRTLHRISCIRNRQGYIVGLTFRIGRALFGKISIIRDLLEIQKSIIILGKPGVGKTTIIREIARVLSDEMEKRVVIIDTSNEIGGDSDIAHAGVGRARRMQVSKSEFQHNVMIEAIENHMPEVILLDEIGTELEALAVKTIAERGVVLVGTAHGNSLKNLIKNPILTDIIGGIQYVVLSDEEAKKRGTQKTILERKASPAFQMAIEVSQRDTWAVHEDIAQSIDFLLQVNRPSLQERFLMEDGKIIIKHKLEKKKSFLELQRSLGKGLNLKRKDQLLGYLS
uniref:Ycf45 n=1 Tax=Fibrocapsa japonica TaxID=94617 RepID=UPI002115BFF6|nr:Ycf45 [Fibrocapsa japonica]UTE95227.1 Ycf45 [Fibrocapsa japonica]